jgi:division protein CdvB (Snf7/Vps24/ESCRT-III family)
MSQQETIRDLNLQVQEIAKSMTKVAENIALLGVEGDADEQMKIIAEENDKVLNYIRKLYSIPPIGQPAPLVNPWQAGAAKP